MIGSYDFCGHYEWSFAWLEKLGGSDLVHQYWDEGIGRDSQSHARDLIIAEGIPGMTKYWQHTLAEEAAGYTSTSDEKYFRIDMTKCPSKGFLLQNKLEQYPDYCDHCIGWVGSIMKDAGYIIDHEHNHCGQCWWEYRKSTDPSPPSEPGAFSGEKDVRTQPTWVSLGQPIDVFQRATTANQKVRVSNKSIPSGIAKG
ncbi:MAG: hypothetical protein ACOYM3_23865 [Terrimicrobiaceae bacterium]